MYLILASAIYYHFILKAFFTMIHLVFNSCLNLIRSILKRPEGATVGILKATWKNTSLQPNKDTQQCELQAMQETDNLIR